MGKTFLIADTHFGDENIIRYESRPFADGAEMDEYLIQKWNEAVTPEDRVFLLGDISFYDEEKTKKILSQLNGEKLLIMGNHDRIRSAKQWMDCGFDFVSEWPILFDNWFILSHEPLYMTRNMPYANVFGHVHGNPQYYDASRQSCCVCVERIGYQPILWEAVKERIMCFHAPSKQT